MLSNVKQHVARGNPEKTGPVLPTTRSIEQGTF